MNRNRMGRLVLALAIAVTALLPCAAFAQGGESFQELEAEFNDSSATIGTQVFDPNTGTMIVPDLESYRYRDSDGLGSLDFLMRGSGPTGQAMLVRLRQGGQTFYGRGVRARDHWGGDRLQFFVRSIRGVRYDFQGEMDLGWLYPGFPVGGGWYRHATTGYGGYWELYLNWGN